MTPIAITYEPVPPDWRDALRARYDGGPRGQLQNPLSMIALCALLVLGLTAFAGISPWLAAVVTATSGFAAFSLLWWQPHALWKAHHRMGTHRVNVSEDGIELVTDISAATTDWNAFTHFRETGKTFVLMGGTGSSTMIWPLPKRGLADPADAGRLREELRTRIGQTVRTPVAASPLNPPAGRRDTPAQTDAPTTPAQLDAPTWPAPPSEPSATPTTPATAPRTASAWEAAWALVPLLSFGMLSAVPFLYLALRHRRTSDIVCAVAYGVFTVVCFAAVPAEDVSSDADMLVLLLWIAATVHTLIASLRRARASMGRVLLADLPEAERELRLRRAQLGALTPRT
ncbi:YcxB family protein, partial [Streptomyces sp. NPDC001941]|uniref:YcxB family protein n=1 Tax=Streptomyces sp. NPDC001941 TaxID=3154659 RepID=UPI00332382A8